jgi:cysteinyl-tRNA synthetase
MSTPTLRLYDTMSREVKPLVPLEPGHLKFYLCGPTVYSFAHIGNFRTFITGDLVVRTAEAIGWNVTWVTNITDVGHLTEDSIEGGEDKMARALRSKDGARFNNVWELAEHYETAFKEDWLTLNLREPHVRPKATQHMREQIVAAEELIAKGFAYETPTGVYFSVDSFKGYGKLSGNTQENLRQGVRDVVLDDNKQQQADFALWKKDDKHLMQWYSPFGWGFPGWHLECSVMARAYLGDTIDLHGGGEDLIFPHHECEIAQSEALSGKTFCNHWIHTHFLQVNGEKMSKSAGNFYTVRDLLEKGADPLAIRYALMTGVYTKPLNFTDQGLRDAQKIIERYRALDRAVQAALEAGAPGEDELAGPLEELYTEALEAMLNDLNTAVALAKALEGAKLIARHQDALSGSSARSALTYLDRINALLGIVRSDYGSTEAAVAVAAVVDEAAIQALVEQRAEAKRNRDFALADSLRQQIEDLGVDLQDTPSGPVWKLRSSL